jgi:hypothetical protein
MVKKVKTLVSEIEQRMIKPVEVVLEEVKEKKPRKPRTKKVEEVVVVEVPKAVEAPKVVKEKRQLSPLQLAYNKYKSEQWLKYKASGTSFKLMLQDEKFKAGWIALKNKM